MWLEPITMSPSSTSSTHTQGSFDECLLVTAKRKNQLLHSQFSLTSTAVTHRQEKKKPLTKMLALRTAVSSDKLLLHKSQKEHKDKLGRWEYNPYAVAIFKRTSIWNACWPVSTWNGSWFPIEASHLQHQHETQRGVCSCHYYSFVIAVSRLSILSQDVWWQQLNFSNKCNLLLTIFQKS